MTTSLDGPEMVLLSVLLGSCPFGRARAVIITLGGVLEFLLAAWTDQNQLLIRLSVVSRITGKARTSRGWRLKVRLGCGLTTTAKASKPVGLVVKVGWVASKGVGVDGNNLVMANHLDFVVWTRGDVCKQA